MASRERNCSSNLIGKANARVVHTDSASCGENRPPEQDILQRYRPVFEPPPIANSNATHNGVFHPSLATKNFRSISRVMTKILSFRLRDSHTAAQPPRSVRQPSGGRTTQNSTPLFKPSCLGAQTCAPQSGATRWLILSSGTGVHWPSTLTS